MLLPLLFIASLHAYDLTELLGRAADDSLPETERMACFDQLVAEGYGTELLDLARGADTDTRQRWVAVRALGRINSPPAVQALHELLKDDISGIRAAAAYALGDARSKESTLHVVPLLEDRAMIVRAAAATALGQLKDPRAVPYLAAATEDPSNRYRGESLWVRRQYVEALGSIQDPSAVEPLMRCLDDTDPKVTSQALIALGQVTGIDYASGRSETEQIMAWKRWWVNQQ